MRQTYKKGFLFILYLLMTCFFFSINNQYNTASAGNTIPIHIIISTEQGPLSESQQSLATNLNVFNLSLIYEVPDGPCIYEADLTSPININLLPTLPNISSAELDITLKTETSSFNDPLCTSQWHLRTLGAENAYNLLDTIPGNDTIIAVIDTGVDYKHSDLSSNMWVNIDELYGTSGEDSDGNGYIDDIYGYNFIGNNGDPMDDSEESHGTHVAGIIAMEANNNLGGVGLAYGAKVMALKAGNQKGNFSVSSVIKSIAYALANDADIINMSFGTPTYSTAIASLKTTLQAASESCLLFAAAGNDFLPTNEALEYGYSGKTADIYPASFPFITGVMSSDSSNRLSSFSNWNYKDGTDTEYEVIAPGSNIYSTLRNNSYGSLSGTSMATPVVSAIASTLISYYKSNNLWYNNDFIQMQLKRSSSNTVTYSDSDAIPHTFRLVNPYEVLANPPVPDIKTGDFTFYSMGNNQIITTNLSNDYENEVACSFQLTNVFADAKNIVVKLECATETTANAVSFINQTVRLSSLPFQSAQLSDYYDMDSIRFSINKDLLKTETTLSFYVTVLAENGWDENDTEIYTFTTTQNIDISSIISIDHPEWTPKPTEEALEEPSAEPSQEPSQEPTQNPSREPDVIPPTQAPIQTPTQAPTPIPTTDVTKPTITPIQNTWYNNLSVYSTKDILYFGGNTSNVAYITLSGLPSGYTIKYSSKNPKILKVTQNGKITAVGIGTTTVTTILSNTQNEKQYIFFTKITVKKAIISFSSKKLLIKNGQSYRINPIVKGIKKSSLRFTVTNKKIATVNRKTGNIKTKSKGKTYLYIKYAKYTRKIKLLIK